MTRYLNLLYGILTNNDNQLRKTNAPTYHHPFIVTVVSALIPETASAECKRALAEMYIRLCMTDKELYRKLLQADPINSYKLQAFYEDFADAGVIETVVQGLKRIGIPDEERSALPFDLIRNALDKLLDVING